MMKRGKLVSCILALTLTISMASSIPAFAEVATQVSQSVSPSHRLAGINRYATAVNISQKGWSSSNTIILASGEDYADALTSGPLAKKYNAPILLTSKASISAETISEIGRLKAKNIIIIGREGAISLGVATQLTKAGFSDITRIGGVDRYETSTMVAAKLDKPSSVVIVPGKNFPDALSISSIASNLGLPIILSSKDGLSDSAKSYISTNGITKAYVVGGPAVLSYTIEKQVTNPVRLAGANRYETNLAVLKAFDGKFNYDNVFIATGNNFADALAGTALASMTSSPIILAGSNVYSNTANYLASKLNLNTKILALGGEAIISNSIVTSSIDNKATINATKNFSSSGTYSDEVISGSAIISEAGVSLKNTTISGDLLIASTVREGSVDLDNVTVTGKVIINGGGVNSVKFHNMHSKSVELDKATGDSVRLVIDSTSSIDTILISSNGIIDVAANSKVTSIIVNSDVTITGTGTIENITIASSGVTLNLQITSVGAIFVSATAVGCKINISSSTTVTNLNVNAAVTVSGTGKITNGNIGANGTTISIIPGVTSVTAGVSVLVNGITMDSTNSPVITSVPVGGEIPVPVPPVIPGIPGIPTVVPVSAIAVTGAANATAVAVGETLIMSATVTPTNATNQTIAWAVTTLLDGTATINASTGLLTATGIGTVSVIATNAASGITGTKVITITQSPAELALQATAEAAVLAYENATITTLAEVATAEGLKVTADTAVVAVGNAIAKTGFELRVTNRAAVIATAKATLEEATLQATAEAAVVAYETAPITTLAEVVIAKGLKPVADTAIAAVGNTTIKTALALRITTRTTAIATAKTALELAVAIVAINTAPDAAAMSLAIITHAVTLGLNLIDYNLLPDASKVVVQTAMLIPTFTTALQVKTTFNSEVLNQKALVTINSASAATMGSVITTNSSALGLTSTTLADYNSLSVASKAIVHTALAGKAFENSAAVNLAFATAVSVLVINDLLPTSPVAAGNTKMESALTRYKTILALDAIPYATYIAPTTNTLTFKSHVNSILMAAALKSTADVQAAFTAAVTAEAVHSIDIQVFNYMEGSLRTYAVILGLVITDYDSLVNKTPVLTEMVAQTFTTVTQVKTSFDSLVAQQKALEALPLLDAFNNATDATTMGNVIAIYQTIFDATDYNAYNNFIGTPAKTVIQTAMLAPTFLTNKDIQMAFVIGMVNNQYINYGKQVFSNNYVLLGLSTSTINNEFGLLSLTEKIIITDAVFAARTIADQTKIIVVALNSTTTSDYIGTLLTINSGLLGLDLTVYNALSPADKTIVHNALIAATLTNVADVQTAFNAAVASYTVAP